MTENDEKADAEAPADTPKDDNDNDDLDLDAALDALDLDANFLESGSFDVAPADGLDKEEPEVAVLDEPPVAASQPPLDDTPDHTTMKDDWKNRSEIYSRHFKPDPTERAQLEQIATLLGVKSGLPGGSGKNVLDNLLGSGSAHSDDYMDSHDPQSQWNRLVVGKSTPQTQNLPISIVLYQGTVMYKDYDETTHQPVAHHGCDCILLTRGFLLCERTTKSAGFFGSKKQDVLTPLGSSLWTDVRQIQTTHQQTLLLKCGGTDPDDQVTFELLPSSDLAGWRATLQAAATQAHLHFVAPHHHDELGWQHRLCHTPWFTEAVTGEWQADEEQGQEWTTSDSAVQGLDGLDEYHAYAPLHYATRANHTTIMQRLLEAGANPNVEDGEGKTPMYYGTFYILLICGQ